MKKIQLLNKIAACGTDVFDKNVYEVAEGIENPDAIMVRSASMHEMEFDPSLLAIARAGAGVNNIPLDRAADAGIVVFNTPGANANAVKELDAKFASDAAKAGLVNLKGHRSVGGMRASIYNAMPYEGVEALVAFMKKFAEENKK